MPDEKYEVIEHEGAKLPAWKGSNRVPLRARVHITGSNISAGERFSEPVHLAVVLLKRGIADLDAEAAALAEAAPEPAPAAAEDAAKAKTEPKRGRAAGRNSGGA
jgi:hypothetical protein